MWPNPQETLDLVTFTEGILNGNFIFVQCLQKYVKKGHFVIFLLSQNNLDWKDLQLQLYFHWTLVSNVWKITGNFAVLRSSEPVHLGNEKMAWFT